MRPCSACSHPAADADDKQRLHRREDSHPVPRSGPQAAQATGAFTSALEQLSNENIHIRMGAISACEQIAISNVSTYRSIVSHTLKSYVKDNSIYRYNNIDLSNPNRDKIPIEEDIVAAIQYLAYNGIEKLELGYVNLSLAWLPNANIVNGNLSFSNLSFANLDGANLSGTRLHKTYFYETSLNGAKLQCPYIKGAKFVVADLKKAKFNKSVLNKTYFYSCNLKEAKFRNARIRRCYFANSDLTGSDFRNSTFSGTIFEGAILDKSDFRGVKNVPLRQLSGAKSTKGIKLDPEPRRQFQEFRRFFKIEMEGEAANRKKEAESRNP